MKITLYILALISVASFSFAQPVAGKWKLTASYTLTHTNKKEDFLKTIYAADPCLARQVFVFSGNGKLDIAKNNCKVDADGSAVPGTSWKLKGNTNIQLKLDEKEWVEYEVSFSGKNMTWKISYPLENIKRKDTDIKLLVYIFEKA
jgi:hypothetical protein